MPRRSSSFGDFFPYATMVQRRLAGLYAPEGIAAEDVRTTVALDVSYTKERAYAAAVVYDVEAGRVLEAQSGEYGVPFPYIPGYLYLREAPPLLRVLAQVETAYDLILVDAHGRLHPRRAGLATIVGVLSEKPTIGIAKSRLVGDVSGRGKVRPVLLRGAVEGWFVRDDKPFYASPGNLMSLDQVKRWLESRGNRYPKELVEADALSRKLRGTSEAAGPS